MVGSVIRYMLVSQVAASVDLVVGRPSTRVRVISAHLPACTQMEEWEEAMMETALLLQRAP
eukprot:9356915-Prorocentrum_lima.AAC.1